MVEVYFNLLTKMSNLKPVAYECEWFFSLLDLFSHYLYTLLVTLLIISYNYLLDLLIHPWANRYQLSLGIKQIRLIECLFYTYKSSCMLAHGFWKASSFLIAQNWNWVKLLFFQFLQAFRKEYYICLKIEIKILNYDFRILFINIRYE